MDSQVDASQHKFAKPELVYGLAMGSQTEVSSQVAKSCKFVTYTDDLKSTCVIVLDGQTVKNLHTNLNLTKLMQVIASQLIQVGGETKCKLNASERLALTCESIWQGT